MKIAIIGAGIGGLTLARLLIQQNHEVIIYEKQNKLSHQGAGIIIGANIIKKLENHKMAQDIIKNGFCLREMYISNQNAKVISKVLNPKPYSYAIKRAQLMKILSHGIPSDLFQFNADVNIMNNSKHSVTILNKNDKETFDYCFIGDGINSEIGTTFFPQRKKIYQQQICFRGIVNNSMNITHANEIWGTNSRLGLIPLSNNELYWFMTINVNEDCHINNEIEYVYKTIKSDHIKYLNLFKNISKKNIFTNKIYDIKPLKSFTNSNIVLLGDAAHATTPNMGQGAGQAIEDAIAINNLLIDEKNQITPKYNQYRVKHTKRVILTSRQIGKIATSKSSSIKFLRNNILPLIPTKIKNKQTKWLYTNKV